MKIVVVVGTEFFCKEPLDDNFVLEKQTAVFFIGTLDFSEQIARRFSGEVYFLMDLADFFDLLKRKDREKMDFRLGNYTIHVKKEEKKTAISVMSYISEFESLLDFLENNISWSLVFRTKFSQSVVLFHLYRWSLVFLCLCLVPFCFLTYGKSYKVDIAQKYELLRVAKFS
jgi:hypothetical protein